MESAVLQETPPRSREELMSELRTLIPVMGVRKAARALGVNEDTACSWAVRYGWTENPAVKEAMQRVPVRPLELQANASTGLLASANAVREDVLQTRISHARIARRAAQALERKDDDELVHPEYAPTVLTLGKHAALVGGWNADSRPDSPGKAFGSRNSGLITDAEPLELVVDADVPQIVEQEASTNVEDY